jgi:hypothetical protein
MDPTQHEKRCLDVLHATCIKDFKTQIVNFAQNLGFETVGAMVVITHSPTLLEFQTLTNAPAAYLDEFHDGEHAGRDPVNNHCSRSSSPIVWDRQTYVDNVAGELWELQEPFGYRSGIAVAMHLPRGMHFMFGANWSKDRCSNAANFKAIAEDLLSFSEFAQATAFDLSLPHHAPSGKDLSLTKLELEPLRWLMDGLTDQEIAKKLGRPNMKPCCVQSNSA